MGYKSFVNKISVLATKYYNGIGYMTNNNISRNISVILDFLHSNETEIKEIINKELKNGR